MNNSWRNMIALASFSLCTSFSIPAQAEDRDQFCLGSPRVDIAGEQQYQSAREQVMDIERLAQATSARLPLASISPAALSEELGGQPQELFRWVRDETRWLPYAGALRGAHGVVGDRSGSSLDRSLLLAYLLENAGHKTRLVRAALPSDRLQSVMDFWSQQPNAKTIELPSPTASQLQELSALTGLDQTQIRATIATETAKISAYRANLHKEIKRQLNALQNLVELNGTALALPDIRHHWWVQWQGSEGWRDLDPILPTQAFGERWLATNNARLSFFDREKLPDDVQHWLTIQVIAEQRTPKGLTEHVALDYPIAVHKLAGDQLKVGVTPSKKPNLAAVYGDNPDLIHLETQLLNQSEWLPYLSIGDEKIMQLAILSDGSLQDPKTSAVTSFNASTMRTALGALDALSTVKADDTLPLELTAVYVRMINTAQGQKPQSYQRTLMDIFPAQQRQQKEFTFEVSEQAERRRAAQLLSSLELLVQTHRVSNIQRSAWLVGDVLQNRTQFHGYAYQQETGDLTISPELAETAKMRRNDLDVLATQRLLLSPFIEQVAITEANILGYINQADFRDGLEFQEGFDIIHNRVSVNAANNTQLIRMGQGIVDTLFEFELGGGETESNGRNTAHDYGRALDNNAEWVVVKNAADLHKLTWFEHSTNATYFKEQLAQGHWLIAPAKNTHAATVSWWQLNPVSGDTLGYDAQKRGGFVEWAINLMSSMDNASSAVEMAATIIGCVAQEKAYDSVCCIVTASAKEVVGGKINDTLLGKAKAAWLEPFSRYQHSFLPLFFLEGQLSNQIGDFTGNQLDKLEEKAMEGICKK